MRERGERDELFFMNYVRPISSQSINIAGNWQNRRWSLWTSPMNVRKIPFGSEKANLQTEKSPECGRMAIHYGEEFRESIVSSDVSQK